VYTQIKEKSGKPYGYTRYLEKMRKTTQNQPFLWKQQSGSWNSDRCPSVCTAAVTAQRTKRAVLYEGKGLDHAYSQKRQLFGTS